jgi:hypothetical protein
VCVVGEASSAHAESLAEIHTHTHMQRGSLLPPKPCGTHGPAASHSPAYRLAVEDAVPASSRSKHRHSGRASSWTHRRGLGPHRQREGGVGVASDSRDLCRLQNAPSTRIEIGRRLVSSSSYGRRIGEISSNTQDCVILRLKYGGDWRCSASWRASVGFDPNPCWAVRNHAPCGHGGRRCEARTLRTRRRHGKGVVLVRLRAFDVTIRFIPIRGRSCWCLPRTHRRDIGDRHS